MRLWLVLGVALAASTAAAEEPGWKASASCDPAMHGKGCCDEPTCAGGSCGGGKCCDTRVGYGMEAGDHAGLRESRLTPADSTTRMPPNWTGDIEPRPVDPWVAEATEAHRLFLQPLVLPSVFPEVSARLATVAGVHRATDSLDLDQVALLSLYAVDLTFPVFTVRDAATVSAGSFRVDAKLPYRHGRHVMTLFLGADIPVEGTLIANGGAHTMFGYAFGSHFFQGQARIGYGEDRLIANWGGDLRPGFLYDAAAAVRPWYRLQFVVQADGRKVAGADAASFRLWPAVRYFPIRESNFSLGAGGMFWWDHAGGDWALHRPGGLFDVSWAFL